MEHCRGGLDRLGVAVGAKLKATLAEALTSAGQIWTIEELLMRVVAPEVINTV